MSPDLIGAALGFLITIAVFSYLFGDNKFFRLALYIFIGAAAGYVAVVIIYNVLIPRLFYPVIFDTQGQRFLLLVPLILGFLLLFKLSPRTAWLGNASMALLVGVGAATAIGGAVKGTIFPFVTTPMPDNNLLNGLIILIGTLATLIYFQFGIRQKGPDVSASQQVLAGIGVLGQMFIAIALGAIFAGVYTAALTAFIERINSMWLFLLTILPF